VEENQRIILTKRLLKEGLLRLLKVKNIDKIINDIEGDNI